MTPGRLSAEHPPHMDVVLQDAFTFMTLCSKLRMADVTQCPFPVIIMQSTEFTIKVFSWRLTWVGLGPHSVRVNLTKQIFKRNKAVKVSWNDHESVILTEKKHQLYYRKASNIFLFPHWQTAFHSECGWAQTKLRSSKQKRLQRPQRQQRPHRQNSNHTQECQRAGLQFPEQWDSQETKLHEAMARCGQHHARSRGPRASQPRPQFAKLEEEHSVQINHAKHAELNPNVDQKETRTHIIWAAAASLDSRIVPASNQGARISIHGMAERGETQHTVTQNRSFFDTTTNCDFHNLKGKKKTV